MQTYVPDIEFLTLASKQWNKKFVRFRQDLPLAGSPERTLWRTAVETEHGGLFVLEKIPSRKYGRKNRIAKTLQWLSDQGMKPVAPYLPDLQGDFIPLVDHGLWQLCPFVKGMELDRPAYTLDPWRGRQAATFLIELADICGAHNDKLPSQPFCIPTYCRRLFSTIEGREPVLANMFAPFMEHLENFFFTAQDCLPIRFCHGDFHPLNMIWGKRTIRAVIDWEFCGPKAELYDLANLLGCLGMEDPKSLWGSFSNHLVHDLKKAAMFCPESWETLPDLMLAIRFAWLSEWLRKQDQPMIRLEAAYMEFLLSHRTSLPIFSAHK